MKAFGACVVGAAVVAGVWVGSARTGSAADDGRERVKLPAMMQEHMLANMRDHLVAVEEILAALALGKAEDAAGVAEKRLGMSSLSLHGASHMAKFMPEPMRQMGTRMHRAASRFAIVAKDAEVEQSIEAQRGVFKALQEITENCNACHRAYRIR